jgi:hypothetical protein
MNFKRQAAELLAKAEVFEYIVQNAVSWVDKSS